MDSILNKKTGVRSQNESRAEPRGPRQQFWRSVQGRDVDKRGPARIQVLSERGLYSMNRILLLLLLTSSLTFGQDWPVYGGDAGGARYSPLKEINRSNV